MVKKIANKIRSDNEQGARRALIEDLFYDFHRSRRQVYAINFYRGIFLGVGTVIGGSIVVAIIVWLLSLLTDIPGGVGDFVKYVVDIVQNAQHR